MTQHKNLGVNFSNNLHWTKHYEIIITKAYQMLGLLRRTFKLNSIEARKQLYIFSSPVSSAINIVPHSEDLNY